MNVRMMVVLTFLLLTAWGTGAEAQADRELADWFRGREAGNCANLEIRLPDDVTLQVRERDNELYVLHGCPLEIAVSRIEVDGDAVIRSFADPAPAQTGIPPTPGDPGRAGRSGQNGKDGANGAAGKAGLAGPEGKSAGKIRLQAETIEGEGTLTLANHGQDGGTGGKGGRGQNGQAGGNGKKGKSGITGCEKGGGDGGDGGRAGNGGPGGKGGSGGSGGLVQLSESLQPAVEAGTLKVGFDRGRGGAGGAPGACGSPGARGGGGNGDGFCGGGDPGSKGSPCSNPTSTPGEAGNPGADDGKLEWIAGAP